MPESGLWHWLPCKLQLRMLKRSNMLVRHASLSSKELLILDSLRVSSISRDRHIFPCPCWKSLVQDSKKLTNATSWGLPEISQISSTAIANFGEFLVCSITWLSTSEVISWIRRPTESFKHSIWSTFCKCFSPISLDYILNTRHDQILTNIVRLQLLCNPVA